MIEPESFSDSHQAFKHFREVTNAVNFLRSKQVVPPRWSLILCLAAWPVTIWLAHFHIYFSAPYLTPARQEALFWTPSLYFGTIAWVISFFVPYIYFRSKWIKRALKDKRIVVVKGWNWFGPEVQLLMLQEFTEHLADRGFHNPEAINQLIEARWRPISLILTQITLAVALIIAFLQPVFSQFLVVAHASGEDIALLAKLGALLFLLLLVCNLLFYMDYFSYFRRERAIFMHGLSTIRLSLLKRYKHRLPICKPAQRKIRHQRARRLADAAS